MVFDAHIHNVLLNYILTNESDLIGKQTAYLYQHQIKVLYYTGKISPSFASTFGDAALIRLVPLLKTEALSWLLSSKKGMRPCPFIAYLSVFFAVRLLGVRLELLFNVFVAPLADSIM